MPYSSNRSPQKRTNNENMGRQLVQVSPYRRTQNGRPVDVSGYTRLSPVADSGELGLKKDMGTRLDITKKLRQQPAFIDDEDSKLYRLDRDYVNGLTDGRSPWLEFDGKYLRLYEGGDLVKMWPAVSGDQEHRSDLVYPSITNQQKFNKGPLPERLYLARKEKYQEIKDIGAWEQFWSNNTGGGYWPGGTRSWGEQRIWLAPNGDNRAYKRKGFTIHGGDTPGSAGCIDLTTAMPDFAKYYKGYDQDILVVVRYPYPYP